MTKQIKSAISFFVCLCIMLSLVSCAIKPKNNGATQPPFFGTLMWNGIELVREDYYGRVQDAFVPENVLTTLDQTLTVFFSSSWGSDELEYGVTELIQIYLDSVWYTLPLNLSQRNEPLILEPSVYHEPYFSWSVEGRTQHAVDLSPTGGLVPGRYRLVEKFFVPRLQLEQYTLANFWVIEPGSERPPESEMEGPARAEDIVLRVESLAAARRVITDKDMLLSIFIENLSGKTYAARSAALEMKQGKKWINVEYQHANLGLQSAWTGGENMFFLNEPLTAGDYRLRLTLSLFRGSEDGTIEREYEFAVTAYEKAPEPKWEISLLSPSRYNAAQQSEDIKMILKNSMLNEKNHELAFTLKAQNDYAFGEDYAIDVLLDEKWYAVPFFGDILLIGYSTQLSGMPVHDPVSMCRVLPAGQYRMIKEFGRYDPDASSGSGAVYLSREFAVAEFTVEGTLDWLALMYKGR